MHPSTTSTHFAPLLTALPAPLCEAIGLYEAALSAKCAEIDAGVSERRHRSGCASTAASILNWRDEERRALNDHLRPYWRGIYAAAERCGVRDDVVRAAMLAGGGVAQGAAR